MTNINDVLADRAKTHGNYRDHARITQKLKKVVADELGLMDKTLTATMQETLDMTMHKIGRIIAGNQHEPDHWRDIAGYNMLVCNEIELDNAAPKIDAQAAAAFDKEISTFAKRYAPKQEKFDEAQNNG